MEVKAPKYQEGVPPVPSRVGDSPNDLAVCESSCRYTPPILIIAPRQTLVLLTT